jgi:hypothetical protein
MAGYQAILELRRLEERITSMGFRMGHPKHGNLHELDQVALFPRDDCLPIYSRDAELYIGTLENMRIWLDGYEKARTYDKVLGLSNDEKRQKKEDEYRHKELLRKLKTAGPNERKK